MLVTLQAFKIQKIDNVIMLLHPWTTPIIIIQLSSYCLLSAKAFSPDNKNFTLGTQFSFFIFLLTTLRRIPDFLDCTVLHH